MNVKLVVTILIFVMAFYAMGMLFELRPTGAETQIIYQTVKEYVNRTIEVPVGQIYEKNETVYGVAIYNTTSGSAGELVKIILFLRPGYGGIMLDVSYETFGVDLQESLSMIRDYAQSYTGKDLSHKDIIVRLVSQAMNVQGTSGSGAMAVGLIAMLEDKKLRNDTILTGVLKPDGTFDSVSAIEKKISVAEDAGIKKILVPRMQCNEVKESRRSIDVVCVNTIKEALEEMVA